MIRRVLRKLVPQAAAPRLESVRDVKAFKDGAWQSKAAASSYHRGVEHDFFDNVTARLFLEKIPAGSRVLDVGAGTGRLSLLLADHGCSVLSCDISKEMLSFIDKHKGERQVETLVSSADHIPLESEQFDAVVSMDFMLHFPDWEELLKEQARLCRKGGTVMFNFLSSDNTDFLKENRRDGAAESNFFAVHYAAFASEQEITEAAARAGLTVEGFYPYNFFTANSIFGCHLKKSEVDQFTARFNKAIQNEQVLEFVRDFEETIVRNLPISCSVTMVVKLRKP